jgi:hypothetical protein
LANIRRQGHAGIVDQQIEAPKPRDHSIEHLYPLLLLGHIEGRGCSSASGRAERVIRRLCAWQITIRRDHGGTLLGQQ